MNERATGSRYENRAAFFLQQEGYRILGKNYRRKTGEIDLIAMEKDTLVFIEVKYRTTNRAGFPEEAVTAAKQQRIVRTATYFLAEHPAAQKMPCRFDVVAFEGNEMRLHRNAFGGM